MTSRSEDRDRSPQKSADTTLERAKVMVAACGVLFTIFGFALGSPRTGLSVSVGAVLGWSNLWAVALLVKNILVPARDVPDEQDEAPAEDNAATANESGGTSAGWAVLAVFKMMFLFGVVYLLLTKGFVSAIGLGCGYLALPAGIALAAIYAMLRGDS
jgi:hypothetical protein